MALGAHELESLLKALHEESAGQFADIAAKHSKGLSELLGGKDSYDQIIYAFMAEATNGSGETDIYDALGEVLQSALNDKTIEHQPAQPTKHRQSDWLATLHAKIRADGNIRPDRAAKNAAQSARYAGKALKNTGELAMLAFKISIKAGALSLNAAFATIKAGHAGVNMLPIATPTKVLGCLAGAAMLGHHVFVDEVLITIEQNEVAFEQTAGNPQCHPNAMGGWSDNGGNWTADMLAWDQAVYQATQNDPSLLPYYHLARAGAEMGVHPGLVWALMSLESIGFTDSVGSIADGPLQYIPSTLLERIDRYLERTPVYQSLHEAVLNGEVLNSTDQVQYDTFQAILHVVDSPDKRAQILAELDKPRNQRTLNSAQMSALTLAHDPWVIGNIHAVYLKDTLFDVIDQIDFSNIDGVREAYFHIYSNHLLGPTGGPMMRHLLAHNPEVDITNDAEMRAALTTAIGHVPGLTAENVGALDDYFHSRVLPQNAGVFPNLLDRDTITVTEFAEVLRQETNLHVDQALRPILNHMDQLTAQGRTDAATICITDTEFFASRGGESTTTRAQLWMEAANSLKSRLLSVTPGGLERDSTDPDPIARLLTSMQTGPRQ